MRHAVACSGVKAEVTAQNSNRNVETEKRLVNRRITILSVKRILAVERNKRIIIRLTVLFCFVT